MGMIYMLKYAFMRACAYYIGRTIDLYMIAYIDSIMIDDEVKIFDDE